jgi:sec-independent protein translocase protein TatC
MLEELKPHIAELRMRLIRAIVALIVVFFICFGFWEPILNWVIIPLKEALPKNSQVIAYKMGEQFFVAVIVSFFAALFITIPYIFYQIWAFISPGLYDHEKKYVIPFVSAASIMFLLGAGFAYYIVFPYGFTYLVNFGGDTVNAMISIGEYLGFFLKLIFGFGISFELPVFAFFLALLGLITDRSLTSFFKYAILIIFIFAAILTPPDILTQFLMALPLIALYGLSILIVKMTNPYKEEDVD